MRLAPGVVLGVVAGLVMSAIVVLAAVEPPLSALDTARLEALAARQEVMVLQGKLAIAEQSVGACAAVRGQLEMLVSKAVIDAKQAEFLRHYEAEHPGFTWDFEKKAPVKRDGR